MTSVCGPRTFRATQGRAATSPSSTASGKPAHGEYQAGDTHADEPTHPQRDPTEATVPEGDAPRLAPVHPGELLDSEFLEPRAEQVEQLLRGERGVTADDALRLARYFNTTPEFWLNLQAHHDLEIARERIRQELEAITPRAGDA